MGRTTHTVSRAGFIADHNSIDRDPGRQIDWANVADSYKNADGKKVLPAGTIVGDLLGAGKVSPRVVTTNPAVGILETTAIEGDPTAARSGYGMIVGGVVYEELLATSPVSAIKTELDAAGTKFAYRTYTDQR